MTIFFASMAHLFSEHASHAASRGSEAALMPREKRATLAQPLRQNAPEPARIFTGADIVDGWPRKWPYSTHSLLVQARRRRVMVVASKDEWQKLNKRQQTYMQAIYETDQEQEAAEKAYAARTYQSRPADEWRWMKYADTLMGYTPLKERLIAAKAVDAGTGSTFEALKERGYILIRHELTMVGNTIPFLRLTTKGRKLVRSALQIQSPQHKWPTGQLREWHWKALCAAWKAGDEGIKDDTGYYARIGWNTWLRLRDYKVKGEERPLAEEESLSTNWTSHAGGFMTYNQDIRMRITEFGKQYYRENWQRYRELYPDVEAPEPQEED